MHTDDPEIRAEVLHACVAFLAATLGWMVLSAFAIATLASSLFGNDLPLEETLSSSKMMGLGALLQTLGLGVISLALSKLFPMGPNGIFGQRPAAPFLIAGALAGLTVGFLPGWLAASMREGLPQVTSALTVLSTALHEAPAFDRTVLIVAICIVAPVAEELAFRGFLWSQLRRIFSGPWVILISSLLFVAYHLDPVQSPSLLPTALLLGWVRWRSGSISVSIAAHFTNNALAMAVLLWFDPDSTPDIPLWLAGSGTLMSWGLVVFTSRRTPSPRF